MPGSTFHTMNNSFQWGEKGCLCLQVSSSFWSNCAVVTTSLLWGTNSPERCDESNFRPFPYAAISTASAFPAVFNYQIWGKYMPRESIKFDKNKNWWACAQAFRKFQVKWLINRCIQVVINKANAPWWQIILPWTLGHHAGYIFKASDIGDRSPQIREPSRQLWANRSLYIVVITTCWFGINHAQTTHNASFEGLKKLELLLFISLEILWLQKATFKDDWTRYWKSCLIGSHCLHVPHRS